MFLKFLFEQEAAAVSALTVLLLDCSPNVVGVIAAQKFWAFESSLQWTKFEFEMMEHHHIPERLIFVTYRRFPGCTFLEKDQNLLAGGVPIQMDELP
uniref:Uncharacterized protein n=1 Tax=Arundo donax TaxID=35708 RepID=A0A0A9BJE3_ARUDO